MVIYNRYGHYSSTDKKTVNDIEYYKYSNIHLYKLKSFSKFIELIKIGKIVITFKVDLFSSGKRVCEIHNHGTGFNISPGDLPLLYDCIY